MDNLKILIVDDDKDFSGLLSRKIHSWGYEVISVFSGKDAVDTVTNSKVGLIVLDYLMPGMDGIDTLKHLRSIDKKVPVIMFTTSPDKRSMEATEDLGVFAYIPKAGVFTDSESALKTAIQMAEKTDRG